MDGNQLQRGFESSKALPLTTLSLNDNSIEDLQDFVKCVAQSCPGLAFLSLLKNPCCPNFFTGRDQQDYQRYRLFVISQLPGLKFLDSSRISAEERAEADRVGQFQVVARPSSFQQRAGGAEASGFDALPSGDQEEDDGLDNVPGRGKVSFGVSRYVYYGKQSEGNRFITNDEL